MAKTTRGLRLLKRDREVYDVVYAGWRAGFVSHFYCGRRSPSDPTIVWQLDGSEWDQADRAEVLVAYDELRVDAGVDTVEVGGSWCGFPALTVTYLDGRSRTETHNGVRVVNTFYRADQLAAAA